MSPARPTAEGVATVPDRPCSGRQGDRSGLRRRTTSPDVVVDGGRSRRRRSRRRRVLDCDGLVLAPGLVDLHTHLREPGSEHKETIETGTPRGRGRWVHRGRRDGEHGSGRRQRRRDPRGPRPGARPPAPATSSRSARSREASAESRWPSSARWSRRASGCSATTGAACPRAAAPQRAHVRRRRSTSVVIAEHCEDASLAEGGQMHEGSSPSSLGLAGQPREAEEVVVARDLAIARLTGGRLHLLPPLDRPARSRWCAAPRPRASRVTAEVTPHHLVFSDGGPRHLRHEHEDEPAAARRARTAAPCAPALADGTIDAIATDHAPHAVEEKEAEFDQAPFGTIGLETALAAVLTHLVETGRAHAVARDRRPVRPRPRGSSAPATTAARSSPAAPPTWSCSTRRPSGWSSHRSRRRAGTPRSSGRRLRGRVVHTVLRGSARRRRREGARGDRGPAALLALEDGSAFRGTGVQARRGGVRRGGASTRGWSATRRCCTDPSYAGQVVAMTAPQQGNYGMNAEDAESGRACTCRGSSCARSSRTRVQLARQRVARRRARRAPASSGSRASTPGASRCGSAIAARCVRRLDGRISTPRTRSLERSAVAPAMEGADLARTVSSDRALRRARDLVGPAERPSSAPCTAWRPTTSA